MFPHVSGALMLLRVRILPWFADLPLDRIAPASVRSCGNTLRPDPSKTSPPTAIFAVGSIGGTRGFEVGDRDDIDHAVVWARLVGVFAQVRPSGDSSSRMCSVVSDPMLGCRRYRADLDSDLTLYRTGTHQVRNLRPSGRTGRSHPDLTFSCHVPRRPGRGVRL